MHWLLESLLLNQSNLFLKMIWKTACDLEEFWLAEVCPDVLRIKDSKTFNSVCKYSPYRIVNIHYTICTDELWKKYKIVKLLPYWDTV